MPFGYLKVPKYVDFSPKKTILHLPLTSASCQLRVLSGSLSQKGCLHQVVPRHLHPQLRARRWGSWTNNCLFGFVTSRKQNTNLETSRKPRFAEDFTCPLPAPHPSSISAATWSSHRGILFWAQLRMTTASENSTWSQKQICS